jgi:hypothetical protein
MPKPIEKPIKNFEEYLEVHCPGIDPKDVKEYAEEGRKFLIDINDDTKPLPKGEQQKNMACLHWYLLQESFKDGRPFSKGTFNLRMNDDKSTERLYDYLKGDAENLFKKNKTISAVKEFFKGLFSGPVDKSKPYSRASSHYNDQLHKSEDGHFGIDNDKSSPIPLAWKFTTQAFALTKPKGGGPLSLYIKPETEGANLNNTLETIRHGINFVKSLLGKVPLLKKIFPPESLHRMSESYRESHIDKEVIKKAIKISDPKLKEKLKSCGSIPKIREVLGKNDTFDDYLLDKYGTVDQKGQEVRVAFDKSGELKSEQKILKEVQDREFHNAKNSTLSIIENTSLETKPSLGKTTSLETHTSLENTSLETNTSLGNTIEISPETEEKLKAFGKVLPQYIEACGLSLHSSSSASEITESSTARIEETRHMSLGNK